MDGIAHSSRFKRRLAALSFAPLLFIGGCNTEFNFAYDKDGLNKPPVVKHVPLNDTGITTCGNYEADKDAITHNNKLNCNTAGSTQTTAGTDGANLPVPAGQDAVYGRDALAAKGQLTKVGYGPAGFDYTKLDANGDDLDENATNWSCVRDNITGLIWEVKTPAGSGGLRDASYTYTWYNDDPTKNGGYEGTPNGNSLSKCLTDGRCDTEKFVEDVNTQGLCGESDDWRLPSAEELSQLVNHGAVTGVAINTALFPHTQANNYWSSSPVADSSYYAWFVYFGDGFVGSNIKSDDYYVRLVRGGQ